VLSRVSARDGRLVDLLHRCAEETETDLIVKVSLLTEPSKIDDIHIVAPKRSDPDDDESGLCCIHRVRCPVLQSTDKPKQPGPNPDQTEISSGV